MTKTYAAISPDFGTRFAVPIPILESNPLTKPPEDRDIHYRNKQNALEDSEAYL